MPTVCAFNTMSDSISIISYYIMHFGKVKLTSESSMCVTVPKGAYLSNIRSVNAYYFINQYTTQLYHTNQFHSTSKRYLSLKASVTTNLIRFQQFSLISHSVFPVRQSDFWCLLDHMQTTRKHKSSNEYVINEKCQLC